MVNHQYFLKLIAHSILLMLLLLACSYSKNISASFPTGVSSTMDASLSMCSNPISTNDFDEIKETLSNVVERVTSLEEFDAWLRSQECIKSVNLEDFLIKTEPPQREFVVEFKMADSSTKKKAIDIVLLGDQGFRLSEFYDL